MTLTLLVTTRSVAPPEWRTCMNICVPMCHVDTMEAVVTLNRKLYLNDHHEVHSTSGMVYMHEYLSTCMIYIHICVTTQQKTDSVCMFVPPPVFNSLLVATLKHVKEFFTTFLKLKKNSEKANPSSSSKWSKVKTTMKTYTCDLISVKSCLVWFGS